MNAQIIEHAPAKINLALHVTGRREDGYHLLDTLVAFTEAGDRILVETASTDSLSIDGPFASHLTNDVDNLVLRARDLVRELAGPRPPVAIRLHKNLPIASGIGGGSSDAAATLRALYRYWQIDLPHEALARHALSLGADVPMCVQSRSLIAQGIGEAMRPVSLPSLSIVLVNPGIPVATPAVFRALHRRENPALPPLNAICSATGLVEWLRHTRNDLEAPALSVVPQIGVVTAALRDQGSAIARMSGSGATCFGIFADDEEAARAAAAIASANPLWYVKATRTLERASEDVTH